ncbi:MAG: hypothetical protein WBG30_00750, partial [Psychrilyobacter sp.]|uniref:hypothetical protein n=1 Tax=Psychrilyobacter sp. TaxID=2586924 RepID=UPI003C73FA1C
MKRKKILFLILGLLITQQSFSKYEVNPFGNTMNVDTSFGMAGQNPMHNIINNGTINVRGGWGLYLTSSPSIKNNGVINVDNNGTNPNHPAIGIYARNIQGPFLTEPTIENHGIIHVRRGTGIKALGYTTVKNVIGSSIIVNDSGIGIDLEGENKLFPTITNNGSIIVNDSGTGIILQSHAQLKNQGTFIVNNTGKGIIVKDIASSLTNKSSIIVNDSGTGIISETNSQVTNQSTGAIIVNDSGTGISAIDNSKVTNQGEITTNHSGTGIVGQNYSTVTNAKNITVKGPSTGIVGKDHAQVTNLGLIVVDRSGNGIVAQGDSTVTNAGSITVKGPSTGIIGKDHAQVTNLGLIAVDGFGIGIKSFGANIYNNGTISAPSGHAIAMSAKDEVLELGEHSKLTGITDGFDGEDTLILSGNGIMNLGINSIRNFEKLVTTGNVTVKGTYNLGVSNGSGYQKSAFSPIKYSLNDASGAKGNLIVDGTINVAVNYDGITARGTDKTGKIIANTITKTNNGHIILVNGGKTPNGIITELENNNK